MSAEKARQLVNDLEELGVIARLDNDQALNEALEEICDDED